ncbi:MAG: cytochrome c biogenesis protein CcdA [Acidimicrobiales bacterium]|nr:cytochrome c biogenesis protein CcdA [Acidimicrobiales bacterium]
MDAPLALAFTAGLVATVNPCGFAMLPAYLSYFVGMDDTGDGGDTEAGLARALAVGATVSAGFIVVFAVVGTVVRLVTASVMDVIPWLGVVVGIAVLGLGVAMLLGFKLTLSLPRLDKGGRHRTLTSMFVFGVSYAVASLGCTLPLFLSLVAGTFTRENVASGIATFVAYALGMGLVLTALTVTLALAKQSLVRGLRRALPYVDRISGALLVVAGVYVTYYWLYDLLTDPGTSGGSGVIRWVESLSGRLATNIQNWGAARVGLVLVAVVAAAAISVVLLRRGSRRTAVEPAAHAASDPT